MSLAKGVRLRAAFPLLHLVSDPINSLQLPTDRPRWAPCDDQRQQGKDWISRSPKLYISIGRVVGTLTTSLGLHFDATPSVKFMNGANGSQAPRHFRRTDSFYYFPNRRRRHDLSYCSVGVILTSAANLALWLWAQPRPQLDEMRDRYCGRQAAENNLGRNKLND